MNKYILGLYAKGEDLFESSVKANTDLEGIVKCMQVVPEFILQKATRLNISKEIDKTKYKLFFFENK